jgi:hypothetical protein
MSTKVFVGEWAAVCREVEGLCILSAAKRQRPSEPSLAEASRLEQQSAGVPGCLNTPWWYSRCLNIP